jgi:hypothetical protein
VVAVIIAGLLLVLVAGPKSVVPELLARFAVGSDEEVDRILQAPSVVDRFRDEQGNRNIDREVTPPLVSQAEIFAGILNPPKPPPRLPETQLTGRRPPVRPKVATSSKFVLVGTSFVAADPDGSFAFIRLQDNSHRWVRKGDAVGHQVVKEIKHGSIVFRDGQKDVEMPVEDIPETANMLEGGHAASAPPQTARAAVGLSEPASGRITGRSAPRPWGRSSSDPKLEAVKRDNMAAIVERLRKAKEAGGSPEEKTAEIQKMIAEYKEYKSSRVSAEEARELEDLGRELNESKEAPPRSPRVNIDRKLGVRQPTKK